MRRTIKRIALLALALMLCCTALAESFDLNREGSITVQIQTARGTKVKHARIELYKVADVEIVDSNIKYVLTDDFAACDVDLADVNASGLAATLNTAAKNATPIAKANTDSKGLVTFSNLEAGLYLVTQNGFTKKMYYTEISPFLVSVPMTNAEGTGWVYDINANPKVKAVSKPTATPSTTNEPTDEPLPQTGLLRWPIPVLGIGGILMFCLGWALFFMRKNQKDA